MKKQDKSVSDLNNVRQKAEKLIKNIPLEINSTLSESESIRLLHELQVYQIELELQNEELRLAKDEAEVASQKYTELYDFAPSCYFTLSEEGNIRELNFSGAHMLGKERRNLMNSSFELFVSEETKPIFNLFLQRIFNNRTRETCEVTLSLKDNSLTYIYLTGIVTQKGDQCVVNAVDISERKHAEQALREGEERNHDLILHTSMDGFMMFDKHGFLLEVNDTYCQMSGYTMQELLSMRIFDLEAVEADDDIGSQIKKVISLGATCFEARQRRKDGSIFNVEVSIQYRLVNEGQFVAFVHNITERKQAEKALFESNEQFRLLFEYSSDAILFTNPDGSICLVNPSAERMLGRSKEEIIRLGRYDISNVDDPRLIPALEERRKTGSFKGELTYLRKDGTIFPVDMISNLYKDSNGIERSNIVARDITERKKAEVSLRKSEERYRTLFNSMIEAFCVLEMVFDENMKAVDYRFLETNAAFEENCGLKDVEGKLIRDIAPDMEDYWFELYGEIALTGEMMRFENEAKPMNRWFEVSAFRMGGEGSLKVAVCFSDITERKHSELALRESDERVRFKLQSILSPEGNIGDLELNDIIDVPTLQKLMDNFYELVQIPIAIIDIKGKVLVGVGWQDICTKFHRVHLQTCTNCIESDVHLTQGIPDGEFRLYKCKNNMWDMATPLIIGGEHKGNLFLGQFFFDSEPVDYQLFREQGDQYGFDEHEYMGALEKAPRLNHQMLDHAKAFFLNLARSISQLSYSNIKLAKAITQQKQVEDALRESEELLNKAQEIGHLGSWSLDLITNQLTWSKEIYRIFGLQHKELSLTYEGFLEAIHPEDREAVNWAFTNSLLEGEDSYEIEHRIIRKHSSEIRYVWEKGENIKDLSGKVVRCIGMVLDITERKQSGIALIENERLLRESQTIAHIGSYSADLINQSWKASPEINEIFGMEESHPHTLDALFAAIHPDFYEQLAKDLFQVKNKDKHFEHEYKIIRVNDGVHRWVQGLGEFEYDSQMNPCRLIGTIQDITERKGKEEALLKLNQTLAALSKSSQAMAQSVDEAEYLKQVCQIVVDDTDFAMVGIGFAQDDETKTIRPMASAGFKDDYFQTIKLSWDDTEIGRGPIGAAIRTGSMSMCNNILTDPAFEPWREQALKRGYASTIVLPLKTGDKTFGTISIYSKQPNAFLDVEIQLLTELANDLSHGITTIRLRAAHKLAEKALSKSHDKLEVLVKERTSELQVTNELLKNEINKVKQKKQSLILAEEKYRTVADHTHGWEFWLDKDDHFIYCSPSCERITGYKASEFLENPGLLFDIIHPHDKKSFRDHKKTEDLCQVGNHELQYRIIHTDGSMRWIGHECQPITDESGHFMGVRGSNKDITGRKEIEQLLKINNQKYKLLSENITDGIFICKNGCFEYVNKAMSRIFGYANNKMEGLMLIQLALPDYHQELNTIFSINSTVNQLQNIEIECSRKDHSTIHVEILFNYIAKEKVIYGVVHDITDKKQIQKNMVKAIILTEEKERAYFSKELHDGLGPLLSTIKLYLQWAARPKANKSREEIIHKAESVLEDALTTVKEVSNKLSPHLLNYYGLTSAIQSFVDKLEATSAVKITFESNTSRRLGNEIEAALYRAIIECINNTIKHAEASNIYIRLNDMDNQLHLQYRDDGKGFDIEYIISIKKGLGLFNLQNRIQTIGGKINLFSEPGKGVDYQITVDL